MFSVSGQYPEIGARRGQPLVSLVSEVSEFLLS
jgi:hypothetical protein